MIINTNQWSQEQNKDAVSIKLDKVFEYKECVVRYARLESINGWVYSFYGINNVFIVNGIFPEFLGRDEQLFMDFSKMLICVKLGLDFYRRVTDLSSDKARTKKGGIKDITCRNLFLFDDSNMCH